MTSEQTIQYLHDQEEIRTQERNKALRERDEAVALLRAVNKPFHSMALIEIHAFLARIDANASEREWGKR